MNKTYNAIVYTSSKFRYEVIAKNSEQAEELAMEKCQEEECPDSIDDADVWLSDNQYTDQQELKDREEKSE